MNPKTQFYVEQADAERALAKSTTLENVRTSHLRSAEAWDRLAARAIRSDQFRLEDEQRKAAAAAGGIGI